MAERYSSFESGSLTWLLQRVTAAFLVAVLAFHFFLSTSSTTPPKSRSRGRKPG